MDFKTPFSKDVKDKDSTLKENIQEIKRWQKLAGIIK
jgi:hypothetical protein